MLLRFVTISSVVSMQDAQKFNLAADLFLGFLYLHTCWKLRVILIGTRNDRCNRRGAFCGSGAGVRNVDADQHRGLLIEPLHTLPVEGMAIR